MLDCRLWAVVVFPFCAVLLLLAGCSSTPVEDGRVSLAEQLAADAGLAAFTTQTALPLRGFARMAAPGKPLVVYIEGDGRAWLDSRTPSADPTPVNPVALRLAALDPSPNLVYLARPGQFLPGSAARRYWLDARFAGEVVDTFVVAIEAQALAVGATEIHLNGYSGGGALAVLVVEQLLRAQPTRAVTVRTVAGNLDTAAWTKMKKLSPLGASLNPADVAERLVAVPQLHVIGTRDRQVPPVVLESFLGRLSSRQCVRVIRVDTGHGGPWDAVWRDALAADLPAGCY